MITRVCALLFAAGLAMSAAASDFRHRFQASGSLGMGYFAIAGEPVQDLNSESSHALAFRGSIWISYMYRDLISAWVNAAIEGQSQYGLLADGSKEILFGSVKAAKPGDLIPFIDSAGVTLTSPCHNFSLTSGVIRYGDFDKYANPGLTVFYGGGGWGASLHYSFVGRRLDIFAPAEKIDSIIDPDSDTRAHYFATDAYYSAAHSTIRLQNEILLDQTSVEERLNFMSGTWGDVSRDVLGAMTLTFNSEWRGWKYEWEASSNYGYAETNDGEREGRRYEGYRWKASAGYSYGAFFAGVKYLFFSGNPWRKAELMDEVEAGPYKGFAFYPPTDGALYSSHYRNDDMPPVLSGGFLTPYYGFPRPGYYGDAHASENLEAYRCRVGTTPLPGFSLTFTVWFLSAPCVPPMYTDSEWAFPSTNLGREYNAEAQYLLWDRLQFRLFFGVFRAGEYYSDAGSYFSEYDDIDGNEDSTLACGRVDVWEASATVWF